jgi:putative membrane protein
MLSASRHFTDEQRQSINQAVADAESRTLAEIVPVVATSSGRYDRSEDMAGMWLAIATLFLAWLLFQNVEANAGGWDGPGLSLGIVPIVLILVLAFIIGALIAKNVAWVCRLFTPRSEMVAEVNERARQMFFDQRVHHTAAGTGVLIYISLFERMAVILGDDAVIEKLGMPAIEQLCAKLTSALRSNPVSGALRDSIREAGERLSAALPGQIGNINELPDALVTVD